MLSLVNIRHNPIRGRGGVAGLLTGDRPHPGGSRGRTARARSGIGTACATSLIVDRSDPVIAAGFGGSWPWPARGWPRHMRLGHDVPPPPSPSCDPLDEGSCRILLNEARREIDRLRRGIDDGDPPAAAAPIRDRVEIDGDRPPDLLAGPPQSRSPYEMPSLGRPRPAADSTPPPPPARVLHLDQVVTNVGSLIDRLI